jgi:pimeloyl-ACP methyl ester carboxylesterase
MAQSTTPEHRDPAVASDPRRTTVVLVHGAGHTAAIWDETRAAMSVPSVAVDLPGRGRRPADITAVTVAEAAAAVGADVDAAVVGQVVLVGHSVAGIILPSVAALLGDRVRHLVFVAGLNAPEGERASDVFMPGQADVLAQHLAGLRLEFAGRRLEDLDIKTASSIDSLNFSDQPMRWHGLRASLPRTWIGCRRDPIQPPALQDRLTALCGAQVRLDLDSGHTPAVDAPAELAVLLDAIAAPAAPAAAG